MTKYHGTVFKNVILKIELKISLFVIFFKLSYVLKEFFSPSELLQDADTGGPCITRISNLEKTALREIFVKVETALAN